MNSRFEHQPESHLWPELPRPHFLQLPDSLEHVELPEFFLSENAEAGELSPIEAELPLSLFLPEPFEPRYRYPVVIWLHRDESNEDELLSVMPQISEQNYIGLGFRGTSDDGQSPAGSFHWEASDERREDLLEEIRDTLHEMGRYFRMDPDRIYLAGFDAGATMALELLLAAPELFAGAVAVGGSIPHLQKDRSRFRELSRCKVLLSLGRGDRTVDPKQFAGKVKQLDRIGFQVETRLYDAVHELQPEMLRDINRWLMSHCRSAFV
jgi:phospholipase/carboxylesterase